jgi:hypothetical protein
MVAAISMQPNPRMPHALLSTAASALLAWAPRRLARWQAAARKTMARRGGSYFG